MRPVKCVIAVLVFSAVAVAQEDAARFERARTALAAADYAQASTELGFPVTAEAASEVTDAVAARLNVLATIRANAEQEARIGDPRKLNRRNVELDMQLRRLEQETAEAPPESATESRVNELRSEVADRVKAEDQARAGIQAAEKLLDDLRRNAAELPEEIQSARDRLKSLQDEESTPLKEFRGETLQLRIAEAGRRLALAGRATPNVELEIGVLRKQADLAVQRLVRAQARLAAANEAFDKSREQQAQDAAKKEEEAKGLAEKETDPIAKFEAETRVTGFRILRDSLRADMALDDARFLRANEERTQARLKDNAGRTTAWFTARRRMSEQDAKILQLKLKRIRDRSAQLSRRLIPDLADSREKHVEAQARVQALLWNVETPLDDVPEKLDQLRRAVVPERWPEADRAYSRYVDAIRGPLIAYARTVDEIVRELEVVATLYAERLVGLEETETFIVGKMIWVRNIQPLGSNFREEERAELERLYHTYVSPGLWAAVRDRYREDAWRFVLVSFGILFLGVLGLVLTIRLSRTRALQSPRGGPFLAFIQRFVLTVIISGVGPACLAAAGLLVYLIDLPDTLDLIAARTLIVVAQVLFVRRLVLRLLREDGLAVTTVSVPPAVANQLSTATRWTVRVLFFIWIPQTLLAGEPFLLRHIPRVLGLLGFAWIALVVLYLLRRNRPLMLALVGERGTWHRVIGFLWPLLALGSILLLAMSALGYEYGSSLLAKNILQTLVAAAALSVVYRFLTTLVRRTARRAGFFRRDAAEEAVQQASRVVGFAVIAVAAVMLANFWGLTDLVRSLMEDVRLATVDSANDLYLDLWDVFRALLWILGGHILMRNLPGLYELFLFPRMERSDTGTRFVITTVSKYVVFLVVYSAALLALQFSFSSLGWLFAAASVGIGFGLQEIISNFISGLILFFERPVRVGDIVTVGETTGTVQTIAIRATHVTNFDRQVIIIPNRRFIVDDVINWSHNDLLIRRHVQVGVAYGTDVMKVAGILEELAKAHPKVKAHPAPRVLFTAFGASSLDMDLLIFIEIQDRFTVESELNGQISRRFKEEGVEIPFPQRDLHLRSVQDAAVITALGERAERDAPDEPDAPEEAEKAEA